jgi:hypothetical protein
MKYSIQLPQQNTKKWLIVFSLIYNQTSYIPPYYTSYLPNDSFNDSWATKTIAFELIKEKSLINDRDHCSQ